MFLGYGKFSGGSFNGLFWQGAVVDEYKNTSFWRAKYLIVLCFLFLGDACFSVIVNYAASLASNLEWLVGKNAH